MEVYNTKHHRTAGHINYKKKYMWVKNWASTIIFSSKIDLISLEIYHPAKYSTPCAISVYVFKKRSLRKIPIITITCKQIDQWNKLQQESNPIVYEIGKTIKGYCVTYVFNKTLKHNCVTYVFKRRMTREADPKTGWGRDLKWAGAGNPPLSDQRLKTNTNRQEKQKTNKYDFMRF